MPLRLGRNLVPNDHVMHNGELVCIVRFLAREGTSLRWALVDDGRHIPVFDDHLYECVEVMA